MLGDNLIEEACQNIKTKKDNMTLIVISLQEIIHANKSKQKSFFSF